MIKMVTQSDMMQAAIIHSESWIESHKNICAPEFLAIHTPERQKRYLESEIAKGVQLYMLIEEKPVGIVSIRGSLIENLYVLPSEQNKGYGTKLLTFAVGKCTESPRCGFSVPIMERSGFMNAMAFSQPERSCSTRVVCMSLNCVCVKNKVWFIGQFYNKKWSVAVLLHSILLFGISKASLRDCPI